MRCARSPPQAFAPIVAEGVAAHVASVLTLNVPSLPASCYPLHSRQRYCPQASHELPYGDRPVGVVRKPQPTHTVLDGLDVAMCPHDEGRFHRRGFHRLAHRCPQCRVACWRSRRKMSVFRHHLIFACHLLEGDTVDVDHVSVTGHRVVPVNVSLLTLEGDE